MSQIINFKTDERTKKEAQKIAKEMGISLSSVLNVMLHELIRTKTLYINLNKEEPSTYMLEAITKAKAEIKNRKLSPDFDKTEDAIHWLKADK